MQGIRHICISAFRDRICTSTWYSDILFYMNYAGGNNMLEKLYELVYVTGVTYFILIVSLIIMIGYLLGRITIKGVSLGTAGLISSLI
mgnify:CR=1 FL=1